MLSAHLANHSDLWCHHEVAGSVLLYLRGKGSPKHLIAIEQS